MSKFSTHPAEFKLKNQRDYTTKDRRLTLEEQERRRKAKKLKKKRHRGGKNGKV